MADATYQPGTYREREGNRFVVATSGSLDVESGGEIDIESGGRLEIGGTAFISSGGAVILTTAISKGNIHTTGTITGNSGFVSTGASFSSTGSGTAAKFDAVTSTGTVTGNAFSSTGTASIAGTITSTGGSFTSTGSGLACKADAFTSTGTGTFNAVTSTGTITGNAFTSTGTGTFNAVASTGTGTFDQITTTGGVNQAISGGQITANSGYIHYIETLTTASATIAGYGISHLTASTAVTMPLAAPVAGMDKWITVVTTAATVTITSSSAAGNPDIGGSTQISVTTGTLLSPSWIHLLGANSTSWRILGMSANVSVS